MLRRLKKKKRAEKGFTLIEMLIILFIFSLVLGAASALFVSAIRNQSRVLASQQILSQTSYLMEYMGRAIRMAQKDDIDYGAGPLDCSGVPGDKVNFATTTTGTGGIKFRNYNNQCQEFYRDCSGGICKLKEDRGGISDLTSPGLDVVSFNIKDSGWQQPPDDYLQPRVTIFLEIKKAGAGPQPRIKIQTTISQRNLDIPY